MFSETCPIKRFLIALACTGCVVLPGCDWLSSEQTNVFIDSGPRTVFSLGRLEPATGIIDIRATPGDRLQELNGIIENELTPASGILGYLSSYGMGKAQLNALLKKRDLADQQHLQQIQLAEAQLAQATASKAQATAKQTELKLQQGKLTALKIASELAETEYQELEQLQAKDPDLVTQHQLDKQKNRMDLAHQDYIIARDSLASASAAADSAVLAADANIRVASTSVEHSHKNYEKLAIEQEIEIAKEVLKRSILLAPNASLAVLGIPSNEDDLDAGQEAEPTENPQYTVLKVSLRRGEVVTQAPIMQLGDLRKMVCIAEVYEADVQELEVEQTVTIRSPAFSAGYADGDISPETKKRTGGIRGRVVRIGRLVAPPGLSNRNPLAPADRSVVEVRIEIDTTAEQDETPMQHAAKHIGMQVTVEFDEKAADKVSKSSEPQT
jgi:HlyD family secretion protein